MLSSDESESYVFFDSSEVFESVIAEERLDISEDLEFRVWSDKPESVQERRERFLQNMGRLFEFAPKASEDLFCFERMSYHSDNVSSSSASSVGEGRENFQFCEREQNCGSNSMSDDEFDRENLLEQNSNEEEDDETSAVSATSHEQCLNEHKGFGKKKCKSWLLKCFQGTKRSKNGRSSRSEESKRSNRLTVSRVKVEVNKKRYKELTATYKVQELRGAHSGFIWAMKFSPDGKFMATAGEDGFVYVWRVTSSDLPHASFISEAAESLNNGKSSLVRKMIGGGPPPSVLLPEKAFHIEETPLQKLRGHTGDVLDLAWSNSNLLLSASKDRTVRLWQPTSNECLHVFRHNNYVTCIQFNPVDENYFISGSIDGKARIWGVSEERVVAWAGVRDAISAVCYRPNGKGFIVGSITGTCRFYEISGNDVQMQTQIRLHGRRKTSGSKITGIQICPDNSNRILVSSGDSKLRILDGSKIVHKFRGVSRSRTQSPATFVSSGKHIISVGEDSKVHLWNYDSERNTNRSQPLVKSLRSFEHFQTDCGISVVAACPRTVVSRTEGDALVRRSLKHLTCFDHFSRSCRISATWPEEKLPGTVDQNYNNTLDCQTHSHTLHSDSGGLSDAWGLVIVTADWERTIRTFHNYGLHVLL